MDLSEFDNVNSLDTYRVLFKNGQTRVLTRDCLVHCYLSNVLEDCVISWEKI